MEREYIDRFTCDHDYRFAHIINLPNSVRYKSASVYICKKCGEYYEQFKTRDNG